MKTEREILEAKYRALKLLQMPRLKIAFWACRMRKIQRIADLINQRKIELEQE